MKRIYVHGLGQTPDSWEKTIACLPAAEDSVCLDLAALARGSEVSYDKLYAAFADACRAHEEPVSLCGLSLGGVLALNYAVEFPERVHSLALIATPYKMPRRLLRLQNMIFRLMPASMFPQTGFGKNEFLHLCKTMMTLDFSDSLGKIACPVLVLCGEKDSANRGGAVKMAQSIGSAELCIISGAGHEVNLEAPDKLAEALERFYARVA